MADTPIPEDLIDAQRAFDTASATLQAAPQDIPLEERRQLRAAEMTAVRALWAARAAADPQWATVAGQKAVQKAARA